MAGLEEAVSNALQCFVLTGLSRHNRLYGALQRLINEKKHGYALVLLESALARVGPFDMMMVDMNAMTWIVYAILLVIQWDYELAAKKWGIAMQIDRKMCLEHVQCFLDAHRLYGNPAYTSFNLAVEDLFRQDQCASARTL